MKAPVRRPQRGSPLRAAVARLPLLSLIPPVAPSHLRQAPTLARWVASPLASRRDSRERAGSAAPASRSRVSESPSSWPCSRQPKTKLPLWRIQRTHGQTHLTSCGYKTVVRQPIAGCILDLNDCDFTFDSCDSPRTARVCGDSREPRRAQGDSHGSFGPRR